MTFLYDLSLLRGLATMAWLSNGRSGTESEKVTTASSEKSVNYRMNAKKHGPRKFGIRVFPTAMALFS